MIYVTEKRVVSIVVALLLIVSSCKTKNHNTKQRIVQIISNSQTSIDTTKYFYNNKNEVIKTITNSFIKECKIKNITEVKYTYNKLGKVSSWEIILNNKNIQQCIVDYIQNKTVIVNMIQNQDTLYHKYILDKNHKSTLYYSGLTNSDLHLCYRSDWANGDNISAIGNLSYKQTFENVDNPIPALGEKTWTQSKHLVSAMVMNDDTVVLSEYIFNNNLPSYCKTFFNLIVNETINTQYYYEEY